MLRFAILIDFSEFGFFCCEGSCLKCLVVRIIRDLLLKRYLQLFFLLLPTLVNVTPNRRGKRSYRFHAILRLI